MMSRKTVSFKERPDDLEDFIHKLENQSNASSCESPLPMLKRELTSLGNPWDVSSPALRQLCNVTPRKRESYGGSLKVLKDNIYLRRSHSVLKSKVDSSSFKRKPLNIYPVLSQITPSSLPGTKSESQTEISRETPSDSVISDTNKDLFADNKVFGVRNSPAESGVSEKKVFGMESEFEVVNV